MLDKTKIKLSIDLKEAKVHELRNQAKLAIESFNYEEVIDICEVILELKSQVSDLNDLYDATGKEFDEQFEILKKYLEV